MSLRDVTFIDAETTALADAEANVTLQLTEDAFRGFYERTSRMLWSYLQRLTGDRSVADDLVQESYYRFLRSAATLETEAHRRHYLFRIATNLARDRVRRSRTTPPLVSHDEETMPIAAFDTGGAHADRRIDLSRAMAQLGTRERAMLWLAYGQGASHKEIADLIGVGSVASVKSLLFRARRRLAGIISTTERES
jgi:RNA polymerase sigma-70 factor, ECF subfamily